MISEKDMWNQGTLFVKAWFVDKVVNVTQLKKRVINALDANGIRTDILASISEKKLNRSQAIGFLIEASYNHEDPFTLFRKVEKLRIPEIKGFSVMVGCYPDLEKFMEGEVKQGQ